MTGRWMTSVTALLGSVILIPTGCACVSKQQFDEAVAASTRANEALTKCQSVLQEAREENTRLMGDLADRDGAIKARDARMADLQTANAELDQKFKDLYDKYQKAVNREVTVIGTGPLPAKVNAALVALAKDNAELMEYLPEYGMIKLKSDLTFAKGSADVAAAAATLLKKVADVVNGAEANTFNIYVAGHTDDIPIKKPDTLAAHGSNWGLSLHRAGAVVKVLAESGVTQERMAAMGFSKYHPIAPNKPNEGGNPLNRRVELWVVPPDRFLTTGS